MKNPFVVPEITLNRSGPESLRQQLYLQIAEAIRRGALPQDARLPSSRLLAKLLHVSRTTIVDVYDRLLQDDLITAKAGSGVMVQAGIARTIPNFSNLRRTARNAHYPGERSSLKTRTEPHSI